MTTIIGSARIGENGHITGGADGDQKQTSTPDYKGEVSLQNFYIHKKGWNIIRIKNDKHAEACGAAMYRACNNPNIGYNQYQRYDVVTAGTATKEKVNADCSSLVRTCFKEATGKDPGDFNTSSELSTLARTGLVETMPYKYGMTLYTGDILVTKTKGHTVIVTNGATRVNPSPSKLTVPPGIPVLKQGSKSTNVKNLQKCLDKLGFVGSNGKKLSIDGDFGKNTKYAVKQFQKKYKLTVDGEYGPKSAAKMKTLIK